MALIADPDPDNELTIRAVIMKYQLDFTEYFGPKYAYGVAYVYYRFGDDEIEVVARVQPLHQSTQGLTTSFTVKMGKFKVWRGNIKLYKFIS